MKKISLLNLLLLFSASLFAQDMTFDYDIIKETVENEHDYYLEILNQYKQDDEMLRLSDLALLYYGQSFLPVYSGGADVNEQTLKTFVKEENNEKIYTIAKKILEYNPVCINALFNLWQASEKLGKAESESYSYRYKFESLLNMISQSGSGKSMDKPFKVICSDDQYYLMYYLLDIEDDYSHELDIEHKCNIFRVKPSTKFNQSVLYIDISRYLLATAKRIND